MRNHCKPILFLLLSPVCLQIAHLGMILFRDSRFLTAPTLLGAILLTVLGAWLLSREGKPVYHALGLVCFLLLGGYLMARDLVSPVGTWLWGASLILGFVMMLLGGLGCACQIARMQAARDRRNRRDLDSP